MKSVRIFLTAVLVTFSMAGAFAQMKASFRLSGLMTMGELAKETTLLSIEEGIHTGNAAKYGASFGLQISRVFSNFQVFVSGDAMWTPMNEGVRNNYDEISWTKPYYINAPILLGVGYVLPLGSDGMGLYAEAGIGANFFFMTPFGTKDNLTKFECTVSPALEAGVGFYLNEAFSIGVHYYALGFLDGVEKKYKDLDQSTYYTASMLALRLGFHF